MAKQEKVRGTGGAGGMKMEEKLIQSDPSVMMGKPVINLMCDECIDRHIVDHLRKDGHEVLYVHEMDPGIPDDNILEIAQRNSSL